METSRDKEIKITSSLKREIIKIVDERIKEAHVTREDFTELKNIVKELAEAQKRTEERIGELAEAQKRTEERLNQLTIRVDELAEAQKRTEERLERLTERVDQLTIRVDQLTVRVDELAEAQKRTEQRISELAEAQRRTEEEIRKLAIGLNNLRGEVGGLARSFGYAFENEAFRMLPKTLKEKHSIEITERFIRTEIGEHEINILGLGIKDGKEVVVVGEAKTRLERMEVFDELDDKAKAVKEAYKDRELVKVLVTHFATKRILKTAEENGVIVIQSFEW